MYIIKRIKENKIIKEYNKQMVSKKKEENVILAEDVLLGIDDWKTHRNLNTFVIGQAGSGMIRRFIKPNLLQGNTSFIVADPEGDLLQSTEEFLKQAGYKIKVLNLVDMANSDRYNPFEYISDDLDVVMMIKCLIQNTTALDQKDSDPFWEKSEEALLKALCFYLIEARPKKDRNFSTVMKLLRCAEVNEQDPSVESDLDKFFKAHEKENPNSLAVKQYKIFKMSAGKTLKSILLSCSVRLALFDLTSVANLTSTDNFNLKKIGDEKTAIFCITSTANSTFSPLVSLLYTQAFENLCHHAEGAYDHHRLPVHVRFFLNDLSSVGTIPDLDRKIAIARPYKISFTICSSNLCVVNNLYPKTWEIVMGNCDSIILFGSQNKNTIDYVEQTVKNNKFIREENSKIVHAPANFELLSLDSEHCLCFVRGCYPFYSKKFCYEKHPNFKYTRDAHSSSYSSSFLS